MKKKIHINCLGYMIGLPKIAVCCVNANIFYIVDAVREISVYAGRLSHPFFDRESGDMVRLADFTAFDTQGEYYIRAGLRRSTNFIISSSPYRDVRQRVLHGIYLNRCGFDYKTDSLNRIAAPFDHLKCHTEEHPRMAGGWHSSGGYSKDVYKCCITVSNMLYSLILFDSGFSEREKVLLTDECRWGLDWLMRMQDTDGGVYGGIRAVDEMGPAFPEEDECAYRPEDKSCLASLSFTAAAALASRYFKEKDKSYSFRLSQAAEMGWLWILGTGEYAYYSKGQGSAIADESLEEAIESCFMWTVCEMYALTESDSFSNMIEKKYISADFSGFGPDGCGGFAALSYLYGETRRDAAVEALIKKRLTDRADRMNIAVRDSGYRTARSAGGGFCFGSNFHILGDCMTFIAAYLVTGERRYLEGATDQFSYVFGLNPLSVAFITGNEPFCCKNPSHRLSAAYAQTGVICGMIVSGANENADDDYSLWHIEKGIPPARSYADSAYSNSTNVPSVCYSSPVIFISAFYDKLGLKIGKGKILL